MSYGYSKGQTVQGDIAGADDSNRDTKINFEENSIRLEAGGETLLKVSASHVYLGPESAANVTLRHNGNIDSYIMFYTNDSIEFVAGNVNYLKLKEGTSDYIEFNKDQEDVDFKLWGTDNSAPAISMDAGSGSLAYNAGIRYNVSEPTFSGTTTYTVTSKDYFISCGGNGSRTINLPDATGQAGRVLIIKDGTGNASGNNITLSASAGQQIDGNSTHTINQDRACITIICTGGGWNVTGLYSGPPP